MQQKIIITFISLLLILGSAYLFSISEKKQDLDLNKEWWVVSFNVPTDNNLDFTLENYTDNTNFSWEIFSDKEKIVSGNEVVKSGSIKSVNVAQDVRSGTKVLLRVFNEKESKEIYKNIN
jgi:hypothetical protein